MRKLFAAILLLAVAACVPESDKPISASIDTIDKRLVGTWQKTNEKDLARLRFAEGGETGMDVTMISKKNGKREEMILRLITTKIGDGTYLSAIPYEKDFGNEKNPGWLLGRYSFEESDTLKIGLLALTAVKQEILDAKIRGKTTKSGARLHATPEELQAWIAGTRDLDRLFNMQLGTFRKVAEGD